MLFFITRPEPPPTSLSTPTLAPMPFIINIANYGLDTCTRQLSKTIFPSCNLEHIKLALYLKYNTNHALDVLFGGSKTNQKLYCVPERLRAYTKRVRRYGQIDDTGELFIRLNKSQYIVDACARLAQKPIIAGSELVEILNYTQWREFDEADDDALAAARKLIPQVPSPMDLLHNYGLYGENEKKFCNMCYEVVQVDLVRENELNTRQY